MRLIGGPVAVSMVLALTLASATVVMAVAPGTWSQTGSMAEGRGTHTSSLLPDGTVLVAGGGMGEAGGDERASSEVYSDAQGTWHRVGSLATPRTFHTATVMASGKVLVAGGEADSSGIGTLASSEVYDPVRATWTATGPLNNARSGHVASLLSNGKVLVSGGFGAGGGELTSAELYDPTSGRWTRTGGTSSARVFAAVTLLPSGRVLVTGGLTPSGRTATAEEFDPVSGRWQPIASMNKARANHTATLLPDGRVLVAGGFADVLGPGGEVVRVDPIADAEVFDPNTGTWTVTASLHDARALHAASLLPSGQVLISGGGGPFVGNLASAELYDAARGTWTTTGNMLTGRADHRTSLLPSGNVLASGGSASNGTMPPLATAELYAPPSAAVVPISCSISALGVDRAGNTFVTIAARDIAIGLQSLRVTEAVNAHVTTPVFPERFEDPAVITVTKIDASKKATIAVTVTNMAGQTKTCDPVSGDIGVGGGQRPVEVFRHVPQTEHTLWLANADPGLNRVDVLVNGRHFRLDDLLPNQLRSIDLRDGLTDATENSVVVMAHGQRGGRATVLLSD